MIMAKLASGDFEERDETDEIDMNYMESGKEKKSDEKEEDNFDPKVVATYKKLGIVMKTYRSGKLPMAFKVIPMLQNWEEVLFMSNPSAWSPNATYEATKIFASNLN